MTRQMDRKVRTNRSQHTIGNVKTTFSNSNPRQVKTVDRFSRVSVHRINRSSQVHLPYHEEYFVVDREKEAHIGSWVLNVIAAREAYQQTKQSNKNDWYTDTKKSSNVR